jgi:protease I
MAEKLDGKRVAFVVTDGFEQVELTRPKEGLEKMGATPHREARGKKLAGQRSSA